VIPLRMRRVAFAVYAAVIVTATHWPSLKVPEAVPRTDLWIHAIAFGAWAGLLISCAFFGAWLSVRNVLVSAAVAAAYAALDEVTQGIPVLNRVVSSLDLAANVGGVALALVASLAVRGWRGRRARRSAGAPEGGRSAP